MPYKSEAQRRFFNSPEGKKKLGEEEVEHWNEVSKEMKLPEKAIDKAIRICDRQTRVVKNDGSFAMIYPWKVQVMGTFGWSNAGDYKTKEEAEAAAKKM